ncbi:hypothetical protein [Azospirillum canadense]|nr:hypothetical protein [Azospirillum canadense]MCW2242791.1 hypothetical protein [Azospirillum canadense]
MVGLLNIPSHVLGRMIAVIEAARQRMGPRADVGGARSRSRSFLEA